ncbi:MAG TPA: universal stress protein [Candidatus Angelobacter sp.]|nr:universal stress protein [Candidatus Angelobacter sp.]
MDLHNILIATDFSTSSEAALRCAAAFAKRFQARLFVVHVISASIYADVPPELIAEAKTRTIHDVKAKMDGIRSRLNGLQPETIVEQGFPSEVILRLAEENSIALLVVGTQGHVRTERLLLGSTAEKIARQARCPVLITPESSLPYEEFKLKTILCPTNFSERSAAALRHAWQVAKAFSAHIILLHVVEDQSLDRADRISQRMKAEGPMSRLSSFLSAGDRSREAELAVEFGGPAERIIKVAGERNADLIVLSIQRDKPLIAHLPPDVTFLVAAQAPCPVLTSAA